MIYLYAGTRVIVGGRYDWGQLGRPLSIFWIRELPPLAERGPDRKAVVQMSWGPFRSSGGMRESGNSTVGKPD